MTNLVIFRKEFYREDWDDDAEHSCLNVACTTSAVPGHIIHLSYKKWTSETLSRAHRLLIGTVLTKNLIWEWKLRNITCEEKTALLAEMAIYQCVWWKMTLKDGFRDSITFSLAMGIHCIYSFAPVGTKIMNSTSDCACFIFASWKRGASQLYVESREHCPTDWKWEM